MDNNDETVAALGGGGRRKGGFEESLRRTARPTAPTGRMGAVTTKSTKTCRPPPRHRIVSNSGVDCQDDNGGRGGGVMLFPVLPSPLYFSCVIHYGFCKLGISLISQRTSPLPNA